jgi:hypothetical protein
VRRRQPCARRCMDASNATIVFCLGCASATDRRARCRHRRDRPGGRRRARLLSRRRQAVEHHSRGQRAKRPGHRIGDRHRHEPVCHPGTFALLGRPVPTQRRKCRQAPVDSPAQGCSPWLKATLVQCGWAAARTKATYLNAQFVRLRTRRGPKKAVCAVAASILTAAYHMLKDGTFYQDVGATTSIGPSRPL